MIENNEGFVSSKEYHETWNPTRDENKLPRTNATEADYLDGYYIETKNNQGPKNDAQTLTIELKDGSKRSIWLTHVIKQCMEKLDIEPGEYIRLKWLGKKLPKMPGGNAYQDWDVMRSTTVAPKKIAAVGSYKPTAETKVQSKTVTEQPTAEAPPFKEEEAPMEDFGGNAPTDDLPF